MTTYTKMTKAQLLEEIAGKDEAVVNALHGMERILAHMQSSKFHCGSELDGYISTSDMHRFIVDIAIPLRSAL